MGLSKHIRLQSSIKGLSVLFREIIHYIQKVICIHVYANCQHSICLNIFFNHLAKCTESFKLIRKCRQHPFSNFFSLLFPCIQKDIGRFIFMYAPIMQIKAEYAQHSMQQPYLHKCMCILVTRNLGWFQKILKIKKLYSISGYFIFRQN